MTDANINLPATGFTRMRKLLEFIPYGRSTIYEHIKKGLFPAPVKLGQKVSAFRNEEIHAWIACHAKKEAPQ